MKHTKQMVLAFCSCHAGELGSEHLPHHTSGQTRALPPPPGCTRILALVQASCLTTASFIVTFLQMPRLSPYQACFLFVVSLFSNPNQPLSSLPVRNSCSTGGGSLFFLETKHKLETKQDKQKQRLQYPMLPSTSPCNRNHNACYHNLVKS